MPVRMVQLSCAAVFAAFLALGAPAASADPPRLTSITAAKDEITVPEQTTVEAKADRSVYNSGYVIAMVEEGRGEQICGASDTCWKTVSATWSSHQLDPQTARVHAEIRTIQGEVVERSESVEITRNPRFFDVDLSFFDSVCCGGAIVHKAQSRSDPAVAWTGLQLAIRRADGSLACATGSSPTCTKVVHIGDTLRGTVEHPSGEQVFGMSPFYTLTEDGPVLEEADDVALVPLAGKFPSVQALCEMVHTLPGYLKTNVVAPSTTSDQDEACLASEQAGHSLRVALKLIAATGGGTAVLWYLAEETARESTPIYEGDEDPQEDPYPVPPIIGWDGNLEDDADELVERNQEEFDRAAFPESRVKVAARMILKRCRVLVREMVMPGMDDAKCLELPIFVTGDFDVPQATEHDFQSILMRPRWALLNYQRGEDNSSPRGWYESLPQCQNLDDGVACHEYPYFATKQGGRDAVPRKPRVKPINGWQNWWQGTQYGAFTRKCLRLASGGPPVDNAAFLVVPAPEGSGLPILKLCNRPLG